MQSTKTEQPGISGRLTVKGIIVASLILVMLIPSFFITGLVKERADRQKEAVTEVNSKWAGAQTLTGPLLVIPYKEGFVKKYAYFLPEQLKINAVLQPEKRNRSIYDIIVYRTELQVEGTFLPVNYQYLDITPGDLQLGEASICMGLNDFKGIEDQLEIQWNNNNYAFNAGVPDNTIIANGVSTPVIITAEDLSKPSTFKLQIHLRGSEKLSFTPVGKTTTVNLRSSWPDPSFDGNFLPVTKAAINKDGFTADWKIQNLNRSYPQSWKDKNYNIADSRFGMTLLQPVDSYSQTMRSVKYAILFIALTFALYFFVEILQKKSVHPIQYVLVGLALSIFYTLLLSISEYLRFNIAYGIASGATILLITFYTKSLFHTWKIASLFGSLLGILYGFIFILIQLQDGALLFGSIGLFILLAVIMYYSRKIDWYGEANRRNIMAALPNT